MAIKKIRKERNILKCPRCGFTVYSEATERLCAKCDFKMTFIGTIQDGVEKYIENVI